MLWPVLGLVRFLLALVVAHGHLGLVVQGGWFSRMAGNLPGVAAVFGFLVISGYSIASSYQQSPSGFYFRRLLRLHPLYVLTVLFSAALPLFLSGVTDVGKNVLRIPDYTETALYLCYGQNFIARPFDNNPVLWSLSLEVFFYALTPVLAKLSSRSLFIMLGASVLTFIAIPIRLMPIYPFANFGINVVVLGWIWLLGFWMHRAKNTERAALVALIIMLMATRINYLMLTTWSVYIFAVATLAIGFAGRLHFSLPAAKLFSYLGAISYPLFLIHLPVFLAFRAMNAPPSIGWFLIAVLAVACALDALYDRPVKAALRRLFTNRTKVEPLAPSPRARVAT